MARLRERSIRKLSDVAPGWLVEVVRPKPAAPPWGAMAETAIAITTPLAVALLLGQLSLGLLPAMGALSTSVADQGGAYRARAIRMGAAGSAAAAGFVIGHLARGHGWWSVAEVTAMAVVSALISITGGAGSIIGLQLLIMTVLGIGFNVAGPPWVSFLAILGGAAWALGVKAITWPLRPLAPENAQVAMVYEALTRLFDSADHEVRTDFTTALRDAYTTVLSARSAAAGPDPERTRLVALLNQASLIRNALIALQDEGLEAPRELADTVSAIAAALKGEGPAPDPPRERGDSPSEHALYAAVKGAVELLTGADVSQRQLPYESVGTRQLIRTTWEKVRYGHLTKIYTIRLALCMAAAGAVARFETIQRSYWVMLTVAIVLKPDFGSVFARALQRALGTMVGALLGTAVLAVVPQGPVILLPIALLSALMIYGRRRNWGLMSTFQAPLVILLADLQAHIGWRLAEIRLIDTVAGCAIVLLLGYLPWPANWEAPIAPRFADAVEKVADYLRHAFDTGDEQRALYRRRAYDALADLRTVFQRALSEPPVVSRRITTWYPALIALEKVTDAISATVARAEHGGSPPSAEGTRAVVRALEQISDQIRDGRVPGELELSDDEALERLNSAVRGLRGALSEEASR